METVSNQQIVLSHSIVIALHTITFVGLFAFAILARGWLANNETKKVDNFLLLTIILSLVWSVITVASIGAFTNKKYTVAKVAR